MTSWNWGLRGCLPRQPAGEERKEASMCPFVAEGSSVTPRGPPRDPPMLPAPFMEGTSWVSSAVSSTLPEH